ncbi:PHA/PHB synthase family protein [Roseibium sp.]|uniref:PHA/PHB synthase family protein n=1 Tax=Roseibium sp. TaxID=1936156 RepID=UPI003A974C48
MTSKPSEAGGRDFPKIPMLPVLPSSVFPGPQADSEADSYSVTAFAEVLDRATRAMIARGTLGISPSALARAYLDWALHLAISPGKQCRLTEKAWTKLLRLSRFASVCAATGGDGDACIEPLPQDHRFDHPGWKAFPFNLYSQNFLLTQQWWFNAMTGVRGVSAHHERVVDFATRQFLDLFSPSNFLASNPEVLERTMQESGMNLFRGASHFWEDVDRHARQLPPAGAEEFVVGEDLAATPGKVVFRNKLIELIQYEPVTANVRPEPIIITPAWIMKYYILDLSPQNSLVKYLVEQGYTVFMISWKNPGRDDRDLGMADYRKLGVEAALDVALTITGAKQAHMAGYCLGGTLLSIALAGLMHNGDRRVASLSLFAAQTDFTEAGELTLFIDESEVSFLEDMMWEQGFLDTRHMAGAFQLLRSNDLIWSRAVREYLLGERAPLFDLMAWNADGTRMPYKMHSEYLTGLFLHNDFAEGRWKVDDVPVSVEDIQVPVFAVGTEHDHVAPWKSVFKICHLADSEVTFVLTSGGHNAGIVSEPGHAHRHYRIMTTPEHDGYMDADTWQELALFCEGSWWEAWVDWLDKRSGKPVEVPPLANAEAGFPALGAAPGTYVMMT